MTLLLRLPVGPESALEIPIGDDVPTTLLVLCPSRRSRLSHLQIRTVSSTNVSTNISICGHNVRQALQDLLEVPFGIGKNRKYGVGRLVRTSKSPNRHGDGNEL